MTVTTVERTIRSIETQVKGGGYADDPSMTALDPRGRTVGGRLPAFADGGKLPMTGPGTEVTDGFLGIDSLGRPLARVDAGEWIINPRSSERYNRELAAINAGTFPKLPRFANGGRPYREYSGYELSRAMPAGGAGSRDVNVGAINIVEQQDPTATSMDVQRRLRMLGA